MTTQELTLIVAATNRMGIGIAGTLPWAGSLKNDMAYFARVTKRSSTKNAVIMGRRTWDSIPSRFQPLADRINIVITRNTNKIFYTEDDKKGKISTSSSNLHVVNSVEAALSAANGSEKAFVIGGAQIYQAALAQKEAKRILLTRVLSDMEFDTKFPLLLGQNGEAKNITMVEREGMLGNWERKSHRELMEWTGESVPEGVQEENGIEYVFEMWERIDNYVL